MKTISKVLTAAMAASLLLPATAGAAKENISYQWGATSGVEWSKQQLPKMDKPTLEWEKAKKKKVSVEKLPAEMDEQLKRILELFPDLKDVKLHSANIILKSEDRPELWSFSFRSGTGIEESIHASIVLEPANKVILEYSYQNPMWVSNKPITETKAKKYASAFLQKALGDDADNYTIRFVLPAWSKKSEKEKEYFAYLGFDRLVNGIPYSSPDGGIGMHLDGEGRVTYYSCSRESYLLDTSLFPEPDDALTKSEARSAYKKMLEMNLMYSEKQLVDRSGDKPKYEPVLKYEPSYTGGMDAFTGKALFDPGQLSPRTPEEVKVTPEGRKLFASTIEGGAEVVKSEFGIDVSDWCCESEGYTEANGKITYLEFGWDDEGEESVYISLDQETSQITEFEHRVRQEKENKPEIKVTLEEAKQHALATLQKYLQEPIRETQLTLQHSPDDQIISLPDWVDEEQMTGVDQNYYQFILEETNQGVPIIERGYRIQIDAATGESSLIQFGMETDDVRLPDNKNTASPAKAETSYVNNLNFELSYVWPEYFGQKAPKPQLVYHTTDKNDGYIDAFTGKLVRIKVKKK